LKPGNLLITKKGQLKIADFGIGAICSDLAEQGSQSFGITSATLLQSAFTPLYADPIEFPNKKMDPKYDVYSLGVIGYQLLVGDLQRPMVPSWRAELKKKGIKSEIIEIIKACVDVYDNRFANGGMVLSAIEIIESNTAEPRPKTKSEPIFKQETENPPSPRKDDFVHCTECGKKINKEDFFCTNCGNPIRNR
jgi:serine/threonine protein kinase